MKITVIDGQGGGLGRTHVKQIKGAFPCELHVVGTNSAATSAMLSAGGDFGATGESAVVYACRTSDVLIAPLGLSMPYSILGEVSPAMSEAVALSPARKILIPYQRGCMDIVGLSPAPLSALIEQAVRRLGALLGEEGR